jgi:hypothetical protein
MKTVQQVTTTEHTVAAREKQLQIFPRIKNIEAKKTRRNKDIVLNIGFKESMIRGLICIFLPYPLLAINPVLLIYYNTGYILPVYNRINPFLFQPECLATLGKAYKNTGDLQFCD